MSSVQGEKTFPITNWFDIWHKLFSSSAIKRRHHFRTSALPSKMPPALPWWDAAGGFFCHGRGDSCRKGGLQQAPASALLEGLRGATLASPPGARMLREPQGLPGDPRPPADATTWASNRPFFPNSIFHKTQQKATLNTAGSRSNWLGRRPTEPALGSHASPRLPPQPRSGSTQSNPNFCTPPGARLERAKRRARTPAGAAAPLPRSPQNPRATRC